MVVYQIVTLGHKRVFLPRFYCTTLC